MKSVKPGRGPSGMSFLGSVVAIVFCIGWTILVVKMGAPVLFALFGICCIGLAIVQAVYHYKNATGKNRYSVFDITEDGEEPDPLQPRRTPEAPSAPPSAPGGYCPYCGAALEADYAFCRRCGKKLPREQKE